MAQAAWQAALGGPHPGVIVEGSAWEWQGGQGSQGEASQSTTILLKRTSHGPLRANLVTSQPPAPYSPSLHLPPPIISHCLVPALWGHTTIMASDFERIPGAHLLPPAPLAHHPHQLPPHPAPGM